MCTYVYVCTCVHDVCVCVCVHVCTYVSMCICVHMYVCTHIHTYTHVFTEETKWVPRAYRPRTATGGGFARSMRSDTSIENNDVVGLSRNKQVMKKKKNVWVVRGTVCAKEKRRNNNKNIKKAAAAAAGSTPSSDLFRDDWMQIANKYRIEGEFSKNL